MHLKIIFAIIFLFLSHHLFAQEEIDASKNVIVIKDNRLDILANRPEALRLALEVVKPKVEAPKPEITTYNAIQAGKKVVTGSIIQKQGFRVQIFNGADRAAAMKIKSSFNKAYPGMRSYMNYNIPNFKIKVGDFETKADANKFLKRVQQMYSSASIVPDVVTIKNIIVQ
jgi:hypothetical protein